MLRARRERAAARAGRKLLNGGLLSLAAQALKPAHGLRCPLGPTVALSELMTPQI